MAKEALFHLPTAPPRLNPPATIWVPRRWRLLSEDDVEELSPQRISDLEELGRQHAVGYPWLLLSPRTVAVPAPPEMFLRSLRDLDVSDDESLAHWCGSWGVPSVPAFLTHQPQSPTIIGGTVVEALPGNDRSPRAGALHPDPPSEAPGDGRDAGLPPWTQDDESLRSLLASLARSARVGVSLADVAFRVAGEDLDAVPLSTARFAVGLRQALTELFLAIPRSPTLEDLADLDAEALGQIWARTGMRPVALRRDHALLESLMLGLEVLNTMAGDAQAWTVEFTTGKGEPLVKVRRTVGDLLAIELTKFLAEHATVKHCERAGCGQLFLRQIGRAKANQHRVTGGVRFCSVQCSQAAQSKAYRDRQAVLRARRQNENPGSSG